MTEWNAYSDLRPEEAGVYEWRMPSVAVEGLHVRAIAHFRKRGAGLKDVLSPVFDRWDGYRVHTPAGLQWRDVAQAVELGPCDCIVTPELDEPAPCPFCGQVPEWKSYQYANSGGIVVSSDPHRRNAWRLECCRWAQTPRFSDPRDLIAERERRLSQFAIAAHGGA